MKKLLFAVSIIVLFTVWGCAAEKNILLNDFEGEVTGGAAGTVDFGAGNGSSVSVVAGSDQIHGGKQSLKVTFDAVSGGYIFVAKGFGLDAKNAGWMTSSESIDWKKYNALSVYVFGSDSKTNIAFDIKDSAGEMWRYLFVDDFKGWKQIIAPFAEFKVRDDWQPDSADKNGTLDFPLKSYQFEPLPVSKGTLYFDDVEVIQK